jgi:hypothetical protein
VARVTPTRGVQVRRSALAVLCARAAAAPRMTTAVASHPAAEAVVVVVVVAARVRAHGTSRGCTQGVRAVTPSPGLEPWSDGLECFHHVTSTPAGWVHESALHCEPLPEGPRDCD